MRLPKVTIVLVTLMSFFVFINIQTASSLRARTRERDEAKARFSPRRNRKHQKRSEKPNIVIIMTDDQDTELGSMNFMPKTLKYLRDGGATFTNAFVTTPMCCPSRSSFLTGLYVHNHNTYTNNDNCSSIQWQQTHETRNFATFLSNAGYRTGYFGKYLNEYNGTYIPPGWSEWVGLIRNTRFYNYTLNFNGKKIKHEADYHKDYLTDLIANDSVTFLKKSKQYFPNRPVAMVLSMPAPHGPEDAAPQYQSLFQNVTTHRTPSWNIAPNPDKQWLLQYTGKMEPIHIEFTDMLHRKRLQTLQSVDDAVEKVYNELKALGELDNTYFIYTSDHGYHLGQYGLIKGKAMPYEFDIRVPFYIRGPKITNGIRIPNIILNLDIAPTLLDMAGVPQPDYMDGRSFLKLLEMSEDASNLVAGTMKKKKAWRDTFLVERGKITQRKINLRDQLEAEQNNMLTKVARLTEECGRPEYQPPCKGKQQWQCKKDQSGRVRMFKCRSDKQSDARRCECPPKFGMDKEERRVQRQFLKEHVTHPKKLKPKFIRPKRFLVDEDDSSEIYEYASSENRDPYTNFGADQSLSPNEHELSKRSTDFLDDPFSFKQPQDGQVPYSEIMRRCRVLNNDTVVCDRELYQSLDAWKNQKERIDRMIQEYRDNLEKLKGIRKHLKVQKPDEIDPSLVVEGSTSSFSMEDESEIEEEDCDCNSIRADKHSGLRAKEQKKLDRLRRRQERRRERGERRGGQIGRKRRRHNPKTKDVTKDCNAPNMNCFTHDNTHWKNAPFWNLGPFCFCPNSNNNTYWCVRTINDTHNFLYCEFITGFISYYDVYRDPYQLRNAVHDLDYGVLQQLHETLNKLRACKGSRECTVRYRPPEGDVIEGSGEIAGSGDVDLPLGEASSETDEREYSGEVDTKKEKAAKKAKKKFWKLQKYLRLDDLD